MLNSFMMGIKFRYKLIASFMLLAATACVSVGLFSYNKSLEMLMEHTRASYQTNLQQIRSDANLRINSIENMGRYIRNDSNLHEILAKEHSGYGKVEVSDYLNKFAMPIMDLPIIKSWVSIYVKNETILEKYSTNFQDPQDRVTSRLEWYHFYRLSDEPWLKDFIARRLEVSWLQIGEDKNFDDVSMVCNLYNPNDVVTFGYEKAHTGLIKVTVSLKDIINIGDSYKPDTNLYFLLDKEGQPVFSNPGVSRELYQSIKGSSDYTVLEEFIDGLNMKLVLYVPHRIFKESASDINTFSMTVILLSFLAIACIGYIVMRQFANRIEGIVSFINTIRDGEFKRRLTTHKQDELYYISGALNDMAESMDRMVEEVYLSDIRKKSAELQLLQMQINPHMLYNSLNEISTLVQLGLKNEVLETVKALTVFYRLSLNQGNEIIRISDEIRHVQSYIDVRSLQYKNRMQVRYEFDPEILDYYTIKIILQPFVENIFKYAFIRDRILTIKLSGSVKEDSLVFLIEDDGAGIPGEILDHINFHDNTSMGCGIYNVNERIKLKFGESYGVRLSSNPGEGTTVRITVPIIRELL